MNKIVFLENLGENTYKLIESNGYDFLNNIEKFCYESFTQEGDVKTFAFILNDNHNNYFAELLSNNKFIKDFDKLIRDKITVFWCEPKIFDHEHSITHFEHFVKIKGLDPTKIWNKLIARLKTEPYFEKNETDAIFPALFLLSVKKTTENGIEKYPITDMYCVSLNAYEYFDNVDIFRIEFINLFKDLLNVISENVSKGPNENKPLFTVTEIKKEIIKEIVKVGVKSDYSDLLSFVKNLFENVGF